MKHFLVQFADAIHSALGCFDRLLFTGYRPISHPISMERWLASRGILLNDFKGFFTAQSDRLKVHAQQLAAQTGQPYPYLAAPAAKTMRPAALPRCTPPRIPPANCQLQAIC